VALAIAMIVARLLDPMSKLATARLLDAETANCSLGAVLGFTRVDEQELYDALDWLGDEQERIENALARRHLQNGTLVRPERGTRRERRFDTLMQGRLLC
jgi:hypothetical protein